MSDREIQIAHIIFRLDVGGLENGLVNLVNNLPDGRYRHVIICLSGSSDFATRIGRNNVSIYDLRKRPGKDLGCYWRMYRLLHRLRPDVVHTRNFGTLDCQFIAAAARVPYRIHSEHGWDIDDVDGTSRKRAIMRALSRMVVHQYMTVSAQMSRWLAKSVGIPGRRIVQIYNGVDSKVFRPSKVETGSEFSRKRVVIGCVGRLDPVKDHVTLLDAFHRLVSSGDVTVDLRLVIVGDGEMRNEIRRFVSNRHLQENICLLGSRDDVPQVLRSIDIFVLPSLNEGISNTILEAMSTGIPVVATAVGGNPELVEDGVTGRLFEPGDVGCLTNILRDYIQDPALSHRHGKAGRRRVVSDFSIESMTDAYESLYQSNRDLDSAARSWAQ
jgi:sugar transferase (PEP-CTERM/EpsH1 system associated)